MTIQTRIFGGKLHLIFEDMDREIGKKIPEDTPRKDKTVNFLDRNPYPSYSSVRLIGL